MLTKTVLSAFEDNSDEEISSKLYLLKVLEFYICYLIRTSKRTSKRTSMVLWSYPQLKCGPSTPAKKVFFPVFIAISKE